MPAENKRTTAWGGYRRNEQNEMYKFLMWAFPGPAFRTLDGYLGFHKVAEACDVPFQLAYRWVKLNRMTAESAKRVIQNSKRKISVARIAKFVIIVDEPPSIKNSRKKKPS